jgi:opacity protein-like surface antigen
VSLKPIASERHQLIIAVDALHPNNNKESLNIGTEYSLKVPTFGKLSLRAGYRALFIDTSEFGLTLGAGFVMNLIQNTNLTVDYAYRDLGILGSTNCFGIGIQF